MRDDDAMPEMPEMPGLPGGLPPFPAEGEWLRLPAPPVSGDFVDRTLARLAAAGLLRDGAAARGDDGPGAADAPDAALGREVEPAAAGDPGLAPGLPPEALAAFAAPEPSPDFVASTLARVRADRTERFRRLMLRYTAPEPTPDFVRRTLLALRPEPGERGPGELRRGGLRPGEGWRSLPPVRWLVPVVALAAALVLALMLLQPTAERPFAQLLASAPPFAAFGDAPMLLPHVLSTTPALPDVPVTATLLPPDGAALWLAAEVGR